MVLGESLWRMVLAAWFWPYGFWAYGFGRMVLGVWLWAYRLALGQWF